MIIVKKWIVTRNHVVLNKLFEFDWKNVMSYNFVKRLIDTF